MSIPCEPRSSSLHVVVPSDASDDRIADAVGSLARSVGDVTLLVPADGSAGVAPYRLAMALADAVERASGRRPRCVEVPSDLERGLDHVLTHAPARHIVAIAADSPRRAVRAVRRAALRTGAHLALLPTAGASA